MPRYTLVYGDFVSRLNEVSLLRSKAAALGRSKFAVRHGAEISALCRGAVVLLSSHIEAYVKELGEHTIDSIYDNRVCRSKIAASFFYHISREKIESIRSGSSVNSISNNVRSFVYSDAEMWSNIGHFPAPISAKDFNVGFSNPSFDKVKSYLSRFGYLTFKHDIFVYLGRQAQPLVNNIDQIVDTRNSIAHGDPNANKTPAEVENMVQSAKLFCRTTDKVFADWCGSTLCKIR